jgi:hypothetical protein
VCLGRLLFGSAELRFPVLTPEFSHFNARDCIVKPEHDGFCCFDSWPLALSCTFSDKITLEDASKNTSSGRRTAENEKEHSLDLCGKEIPDDTVKSNQEFQIRLQDGLGAFRFDVQQ